ncbi:MAG TPA: helix-turn-helix domain-containing protein [Flavobacteriaceae bacterium]|nr:helix-turn-helix domain-containing protein [Flavobacteriaceae bacterium]
MESLLKYKRIHPGIVLERELQKRSLKQRPFALSIDEHPQTLNAIIKEKRNLNTALALKIEEKLKLKEEILAILQTYYNIRLEKENQHHKKPDLTLSRTSLFWDTNIDQINWQKQYKAVIKRVFERGNKREKNEILRFYGKKKVNRVLNFENRKPYEISL